MLNTKVKLVSGTPEHFPIVHQLIVELAIFEKEPNSVINTPAQLLKDWNEKRFDFFVMQEDTKIIGFCLYYFRYSTWKGLCLYLEDLYIQPNYRSQGIGKQAFELLQEIAKKTNCYQINWQVLDWNTRAIDFYEELGATIDVNWYNGILKV